MESSSPLPIIRLCPTSTQNMMLTSTPSAESVSLYSFLRSMPTSEETTAHFEAFLNHLHFPSMSADRLDALRPAPVPTLSGGNSARLSREAALMQVRAVALEKFNSSAVYKGCSIPSSVDWKELLGKGKDLLKTDREDDTEIEFGDVHGVFHEQPDGASGNYYNLSGKERSTHDSLHRITAENFRTFQDPFHRFEELHSRENEDIVNPPASCPSCSSALMAENDSSTDFASYQRKMVQTALLAEGANGDGNAAARSSEVELSSLADDEGPLCYGSTHMVSTQEPLREAMETRSIAHAAMGIGDIHQQASVKKVHLSNPHHAEGHARSREVIEEEEEELLFSVSSTDSEESDPEVSALLYASGDHHNKDTDSKGIHHMFQPSRITVHEYKGLPDLMEKPTEIASGPEGSVKNEPPRENALYSTDILNELRDLSPNLPLNTTEEKEAVSPSSNLQYSLPSKSPTTIHPLYKVLCAQLADCGIARNIRPVPSANMDGSYFESTTVESCAIQDQIWKKKRREVEAQISLVKQRVVHVKERVEAAVEENELFGSSIWSSAYQPLHQLKNTIHEFEIRTNRAEALYTVERHEEATLRIAHVSVLLEVTSMRLILKDIWQLAQSSLSTIEECQRARENEVQLSNELHQFVLPLADDIVQEDTALAARVLHVLSPMEL